MNNSKRYCPKCGKELAQRLNSNYECISISCQYKLTTNDIIDISFKSKGLAKALSNLCPYPFTIDGIKCASMESFIQSLKVKDIEVQKDICSKTAAFCYNIREMHDDWRITQKVYWQGKEIDRHSTDYYRLLIRAYYALFEDSPTFRYALKLSKGYILTHSIGCTDSKETLLTPDEYIKLLNELRNEKL